MNNKEIEYIKFHNEMIKRVSLKLQNATINFTGSINKITIELEKIIHRIIIYNKIINDIRKPLKEMIELDIEGVTSLRIKLSEYISLIKENIDSYNTNYKWSISELDKIMYKIINMKKTLIELDKHKVKNIKILEDIDLAFCTFVTFKSIYGELHKIKINDILV